MRAFASTKIADKSAAHHFAQGRGTKKNTAVIHPAASSASLIQRKATCPCGGGCPACQCKYPIQTKLSTSEPGDTYEQEADRVPAHMMRTPELPVQRQAVPEEEVLQGKFSTSEVPAQIQGDGGHAANRIGMPGQLKAGLEALSGMDLSGIRVHNHSSKPTQLNALAYTQGQDIYVGPGQEKYLPHEGWHAVQQMQGRVKPTTQAKGVSINDDAGLEREADVMGEKALQLVAKTNSDPEVQRKASPGGVVIQRASPLSDAVRLIHINSSTTGASMITENLVTGIRQAENMFLKERPFNRWGEGLGMADTVGPGQLGEPAITQVDSDFSAAATAFAAIHGAAPSGWEAKATDSKWSYFYIACYLAYSINRAETLFQPATPVLSNADLGVLQLGIAIYHGAFSRIRAMRRRIASERSITAADVTWAMVQEELRSGTATHEESELEQYTQLAQGSWEFEFDITARLSKSRRFQIQNEKFEVTVLANYQNLTSTGARGTRYRIRLRRYAMAMGTGGMAAEGFENHGSISYSVGLRETGIWTGLPRGDYYLVIEKIEDNFSPDHLIGSGIVKTIF